MNKFERDDSIDIMKGIGILCMVMAHVYYGRYFDHLVHAFHMPLFFFASGYLTQKLKCNRIDFFRKFKKVMIPYYFWGVLIITIDSFFKNISWTKSIYHLLWENSSDLYDAGPLWFLSAYYISGLIFNIIMVNVKNKYLSYITIIIISLFGITVNTILGSRLPMSLDVAMVSSGFWLTGYFIKNHKEQPYIGIIHNMKWYLIFCLSIVICGLIFVNGYVNLRLNEYSNIILFWINAICSILLILSISKKLETYTRNTSNKFFAMIANFLKILSKSSMVFLCTNKIVIEILNRFWNSVSTNFLIGRVFITCVTVIICISIEKIVVKLKLNILVGK